MNVDSCTKGSQVKTDPTETPASSPSKAAASPPAPGNGRMGDKAMEKVHSTLERLSEFSVGFDIMA
jgi:hypothetical protein